MGEGQVGIMGAIMSKALRKLTPVAAKYKCTIIFINQIREKIGIMFGNPETTPGGKSLGHYASLRIRMQKTSDKIERNKEQIGLESKVKVVKSRFGMPGREAILPIYFEDYEPTPLEIMLDFIRRSSVIKFKKSLNTFLFDKLAGETIKDVLIAIHSNGRMEEFAKRFIEAANKKNIKFEESPEVMALLETMKKNEFSIEAFNT
jgi:recombination protein RecA